MLIAIIDTATSAITTGVVALGDPPRMLAERVTVDGRAHGERLAPQLRAVLAEAGAKPHDLAAVVAGVGPGPFTGLRVGLVTAASLGDALGIPCYGVCSLDAVGLEAGGLDAGGLDASGLEAGGLDAVGAAAGAAPAPRADGQDSRARRILVATDARRKEIYWACYVDGRRVAGPAVDRPAAVPLDGVVAAAGEGALRYADQLAVPVLDGPRYPPAARLAALAADRVLAKAPSEPLTPLYLRRPDAVEPGARKPVLGEAGG